MLAISQPTSHNVGVNGRISFVVALHLQSYLHTEVYYASTLQVKAHLVAQAKMAEIVDLKYCPVHFY